MTGCQSSCNGTDQRAFRIAMTQRVIVACVKDAAYLEGQGLTLISIERRTAAVPVATERRRFTAPWRRRDLARDLTGAAR